jgi:anti-sigma factor RsiW
MADGRNLGRGTGPPGEPHLGEEVADLVLGDVDADRRVAMAAHLLRCASCRREYDELAATVHDLLPAVPGVQPPLGFDERVLARLAADGTPAAWPFRRWRRVTTAVAIAVAVLVPIGVWVVSRGDEVDVTTGSLATLYRSRDDAPVGTVSVTVVDGDPVMVVALVGAPDDVSYYCRTRFADGTSTESESWPAGNGAWIVPLPADAAVAGVEIIPAGTEKIWSSATFT